MNNQRAALILCIAWALTGCGKAPSGGGSLGPAITRGEIQFVIVSDQDWPAHGVIVDDDYRTVTAGWAQENLSARVLGDCDDYAGEAWRRATRSRAAVGMVKRNGLTENHAMNFFVSPDRAIWLYEPQTGKAWRASHEDKQLLGGYWI